MTRRIDAPFLADPAVQAVLGRLSADGEEARVVGGAIRNHLTGHPISDIDIATTAVPQAVIERAAAAGFKSVPTGVDHGTVTLVTQGRAFEVTTLRTDVATDGRHAKVAFGRDWQADAERRDFTINALYCDANGTILDPVGGLADIETRTLRFIGDPQARIEEDYLRILRFYRFFAWYGQGRPDADGVRATARLKDGLSRISAERIWSELSRLLAARDPSRALLWMRQAGILTAVLPESERWGIDAIHGLVEAEAALGWGADPMRRLEAIVPPEAERMARLAERLRMSKRDRNRLTAWALAEPADPKASDASFRAQLYFGDRQALRDRLELAAAALRARAAGDATILGDLATLTRRAREAVDFDPPRFPLSGADLLEAGIGAGPEVGWRLAALEREWAESGFVFERQALLEKLRHPEQKNGPS